MRDANMTRRSLVAALGAAIPVTTATAATTCSAASLDAELIALGAKLDDVALQKAALRPEYEEKSAVWERLLHERRDFLDRTRDETGSNDEAYHTLWMESGIDPLNKRLERSTPSASPSSNASSPCRPTRLWALR